MDAILPAPLADLRASISSLALNEVAPLAEETDRLGQWPAHTFDALRRAKLLGLNAPKAAGGMGQGLMALAISTEALGRHCASSAICYGMHCVGTAVIAAKATPCQTQRYLRPIAAGEHLTTLALSESGSGALFYFPETELTQTDAGFLVNGTKQFVTNAGHMDSYVVSTRVSHEAPSGDFSCLVVDSPATGIELLQPWNGFGMRGNSARAIVFRNVLVPTDNLLGAEGDQIWYVFEVVAPYFLIAMAGTYLGVAQAALDETLRHLKTRVQVTTGETLASVDPIQAQVGEIWARVERTRQWIYRAAELGDLGHPDALPFLLNSKVEAAETAVAVTNEALTLCGGMAYRDNSPLSRLLRDARASHVMSPTTALLKRWIGRSLLGQRLL